MYQDLKISKRVEDLANEAENSLKEEFKNIDEICTINSIKVLKAFKDNKISDMHFNSTTGYGYGDIRKRYN